jgi:phenylalanine-4-hydroxylase
MDATRPDFTPIYARLEDQPEFAAGSVQDGDRVIHRGTGEGWVKTDEV